MAVRRPDVKGTDPDHWPDQHPETLSPSRLSGISLPLRGPHNLCVQQTILTAAALVTCVLGTMDQNGTLPLRSVFLERRVSLRGDRNRRAPEPHAPCSHVLSCRLSAKQTFCGSFFPCRSHSRFWAECFRRCVWLART